MVKKCKRCHKEFTCTCDNITNCDCSKIELYNVTKEYLAKTSYDCICNNCLEEVNNYALLSEKYPFPQHPTQYIEGIHYYLDGQYWVFTNYFHYLKGSCCKNNCRHCAYGYSL
ncbi:cysteine-rich CWC family protein [Faecalibacter rhinopitheci]|uniref:Cysteine-rich CWC family protein n=1 Tax=Faecalibacter rhinopitheci TaxID=2779678 RepID=A0A8J7K4U9_9FLAO|nr:cysteine-rich CWC family protein [Faecalibacter rhinopitheci]MBF0598099.1 cysteine-rich CWC family protein [Faecalibacter rhinopitheci]